MKKKSLFIKLFALVAVMMFTLGMQAKEAYVYYTYSDSTLTFYYDNELWSRTGGLPGYLNEAVSDPYSGENDPDWHYDNFQLGIARVVFDASFADARPKTMFSWFGDMTNLRTIEGWENLNTSQVTSMNGVFYNCNKLTSIDLSHFNTDAVTFMPNMFYGCTKLTNIDLSGFNTTQVTNMEYMFSGCTNLASVKLDSFNTQNVVYMGNMFENCGELTVLNLSSFNTSKLRQTPEMFYGCSKLATIYVSDTWTNFANTYSSYMFYNCTSLVGGQGTTYDANHVNKAYAHIDGGPDNPGYFTDVNAVPEAYACYTPSNTTLTFYCDYQRDSREGTTYDLNEENNAPAWYSDGTYSSITSVVFDPSFAGARPTTTSRWFYRMQNLQAITGISYLNTTEVTNMFAMFYDCNELTSLDVSSFNTNNVTDMSYMFNNCNKLTSLDVSSFNTTNVTDISNMFYNCNKLTSLDVSSFNTTNVTNMGSMFERCSGLTSLDVSSFNTANVTKMSYLFSRCSGLTSLDLSNFNTTNVTFMEGLFSRCSGLTSLDLSSFNTSNVTSMQTMFSYCSGLRSVNLSSFNTAKVWTMYMMFYGCSGLTSLDVSHFNTANVTVMDGLFGNCSGLTSLDLSSFNTTNVTTMRAMFGGCRGLTSLDLSSFNTAKVYEMYQMFAACNSLKTVYVSYDWSTDAVTSSNDMFNGCTSLVGGMGTTFNSSNPTDKTYAHIDGGPSNPGYFSEKGGTFLRGDVNGDGSVNISDVTALIDYLLSGNASGINLSGADCNQDSSVNISDVTSLIDYLLSGTWN